MGSSLSFLPSSTSLTLLHKLDEIKVVQELQQQEIIEIKKILSNLDLCYHELIGVHQELQNTRKSIELILVETEKKICETVVNSEKNLNLSVDNVREIISEIISESEQRICINVAENQKSKSTSSKWNTFKRNI
jgi:hypothetical protein